MVNRVTLVGRLGSDPEVRQTNAGKSVANLSLATDETYKDRSGEKQKKTEWHRLQLWDRLADVAGDYLHKGDLIYVEGKIQSRQYEDKEGQNKTVVEIIVSNLKMLSTQGKSEQIKPSAATQNRTPKPTSRPAREADDEFVSF